MLQAQIRRIKKEMSIRKKVTDKNKSEVSVSYADDTSISLSIKKHLKKNDRLVPVSKQPESPETL